MLSILGWSATAKHDRPPDAPDRHATIPTPPDDRPAASQLDSTRSLKRKQGHESLAKCFFPARHAPPPSSQTYLPPPPDTMTLRETLLGQFDLEILLKHRELRLIDQEIAKCETVLEQLRRCAISPYSDSSDINGPYAQHYRAWLLPEPGPRDPVHEVSSRPGRLPERHGRGVHAKRDALEGRPRTSQELFVQRASDGQSVQLVCPQCAHAEFGNMQAFTDHCQLRHNRTFLNQTAAIECCSAPAPATAPAGIVHPLNQPRKPRLSTYVGKKVPDFDEALKDAQSRGPSHEEGDVSASEDEIADEGPPSRSTRGIATYGEPRKPRPTLQSLSRDQRTGQFSKMSPVDLDSDDHDEISLVAVPRSEPPRKRGRPFKRQPG